MRFRAFPVAVEVDGSIYESAMVWATDEGTEVWVRGGGNGLPERIATYPGTVSRTRATGETVGQRNARYLLTFTDGSTLAAAKGTGCCCGENPLCAAPKETAFA